MVQQEQADHREVPGSDVDIIVRARSVAARLAKKAQEVDEAREVPPESITDLHEAGLLSMAIPSAQGGTEVDFLTQLIVIETIGGACASTGWCLANHTAAVKRAQGLMGDRITPYTEAIVAEGALLSHGIVPSGTTRPAPGGYVSTGSWPFVSGSIRARWAFLGTLVPGPPPGWTPNDGANPPESHVRRLLVELDNPGVRIEPTWLAMSLRASMSHDVVLDEVFVREELAIDSPAIGPLELLVPDSTGVLRLPAGGPVVGGAPCAAMSLGIAQAALRETIEYAKAGSMTLGGNRRTSMPGNQFAVADAAMWIEAGRAILHQKAREIMSRAESDEPFTAQDLAGFAMASIVACENSQKAVDRLFSVRGAHGLYETDPFQRHYRDVRFGTLVAGSAPDLMREQVGKYLFDIPEDVQPRWS
ncbi:MAG: acyl-CoA dehydrogenase family protein [Dehalococcoidia bacterium]